MPKGPEYYTPPDIQKGISLRDLLTYINPNLTQYQKLIAQESERLTARRRLSPNTFSEFWKREFYDSYDAKEGKRPSQWQKLGDYFRGKLSGDILVDIGGGRTGHIRDLSDLVGVQRYINVDIQHDEPLDPYTGRRKPPQQFWRLPGKERPKPMETIYVTSDMLDFVARLPTASSNFSVNGIDEDIVETPAYVNALFQELVRATKVGGILFGIGTTIWQDDPRLKSVSQELGLESGGIASRDIFEKVRE